MREFCDKLYSVQRTICPLRAYMSMLKNVVYYYYFINERVAANGVDVIVLLDFELKISENPAVHTQYAYYA